MVGKVHWHKEQALTNKFSALNTVDFSSEIEKTINTKNQVSDKKS